MKKFQKEYKIKAKVTDVWKALTDPKTIDKWGAGPSVMSDKEGFEFKLWGGDIWGKNIEVENNKKLVQEWFGDKWDKPSIVAFTISEEDGTVNIKLDQRNIPDLEFEDIKMGWDEYYIGPLIEFVEK